MALGSRGRRNRFWLLQPLFLFQRSLQVSDSACDAYVPSFKRSDLVHVNTCPIALTCWLGPYPFRFGMRRTQS